jgi:hypothetical protein
MTNGSMHRLAEALRPSSKETFAVLKRIGGAPFAAGLVAAVLFASIYFIETKAILALESSPKIFEVVTHHRQSDAPMPGLFNSQ